MTSARERKRGLLGGHGKDPKPLMQKAFRSSDSIACDYVRALKFYTEPRWFKVSLSLERIGLLLEMLGNPQDKFDVVHVAGTNGKGSVCACIESILRVSGLKCGLFTSPYIERFEERIRIDGVQISPEELIDATAEIQACCGKVESITGEHPTEFELMCALGFLHFAKSGCDVVVCEVGLGGRLDATNVVKPLLSVIARVGIDHTAILGETLKDIAREKAGIVKPGVEVVSWPQDPAAMRVIEEVCDERGCTLDVADFSELEFGPVDDSWESREFRYRGETYSTTMIADYQVQNSALGIEAALALSNGPYPNINVDVIRKGVLLAKWPGRFEVLGRDPLFVLDGAHNPQGARSLAQSLNSLVEGGLEDATMICGMLEDKDCESALAAMLPFARHVITYTPENPRAMPAEDLAELASIISTRSGKKVSVECAQDPSLAVERAIEKTAPEGSIVSFGSLYSVSDVKRAYLGITPLSE